MAFCTRARCLPLFVVIGCSGGPLSLGSDGMGGVAGAGGAAGGSAGVMSGGSSGGGGVPVPPRPDAGPAEGCRPFLLFPERAFTSDDVRRPLVGYSDPLATVLVVLGETVLPIHSRNAACPRLLLAGDAAGTAPIGWDNFLLIEQRSSAEGAVLARWYYGSDGLTWTGSPVTRPLSPTVSGFSVGVPSPLPFGYEPLAIDLLAQLVETEWFEIRVLVADSGITGSNTAVWAIPR